MKRVQDQYFQFGSNGIDEITYEDASCRAIINIGDFREKDWWATITTVTSKKSNSIINISSKQQLEIYKRISADHKEFGNTKIYTTEFNYVDADISEIDYKTAILDL